MIGQNFMIDLMSKQPAATTEIQKADLDKSYYTKFQDVLNSTIKNAPSDNTYSKTEKKHLREKEKTDNNLGQKPQVKCFREIKKNEPKVEQTESKEESTTASSEVKKTDDSKDIKDTKPKDELAVESLAQVMGIQVQDLMKILASLNIKPEDLSNSDKTQEVVDKLSSLLNLNDQQKQTLSEILKILKTNLDQKVDKVDEKSENTLVSRENENIIKLADTEPKGDKNWVKLTDVDVKVVQIQEFSQVLEKLKAKVQELTVKMQQDPQKLVSELSAEFKDALALMETKAPVDNTNTVKTTEPIKDIQDTGNKKDEEIQPIRAENDAKANAKNDQVDAKSDQKVKSNLPNDTKPVTAEISAVKTDSGDSSQLNNLLANQTQKVDGSDAVAKVAKETQLPKKEIISQVIEKAKVILTPDKSEMSMDLKPDSLGKLSLKVVTERGIVVAKFIAESQQVKETLEANMQLLKDSLEKQGLSVQGFSVSVRQDSYKGFNRGNESEENPGSANSRYESSGLKQGMVTGVLENQKKVNAYNWSGSSIDLTA